MSTFNSNTTTPNFDNLLLQSLLNRLQINQPPQQQPLSNPLLSSSFEDFLSSHLSSSLSSEDEYDIDNDNDIEDEEGDVGSFKKTRVSKEESRLEKEIVKVILSGNTVSLKPNSGQAVSIGDHHVCVGFHEEDCGSGYRVWEWHGHLMLFDDDFGYSPEYIYGNYFERVLVGSGGGQKRKVEKKAVKKEEEDKEGQNGNLGLKELIEEDGGGGESGSRVLHCSRNAGLSRALKGSSEK